MSKKIIAKGSSGTSAILISRITGLIRDILTARFLGGGSVMSAWVLAFRIPNTFRGLLGEGAAAQALVPLLGESLHTKGKEEFRKELGIMLGTLALLLGIISILVAVVSIFIAPLFPVYRVNKALLLMPILMPYAFFVCLASICSSVLNLFDKYFLPMLTSTLLNLAIIVAIIIFYYESPESLLVKMSYAALISGVLQIGWLSYLLKKEKAFPSSFKIGGWNTPIVREFFTLAIPRFIGGAATQISSLMDSFMALYISIYAAPALYFTERIVFLPVGLFAVAMGNVCLVSMTKHATENNISQLMEEFNYGIRQIIYISVPMAVIFIFYRYQILEFIYGGNRFGENYVSETAWAMLFYCFGIPAFCALKIITSAFYAQKDTKTPLKVALWCILLNFIISFVLMFPLQQGGIALGTVISSSINCFILIRILKKRNTFRQKNNEIFSCLCKIGLSSIIAVFVSLYVAKLSTAIYFFKLINWKGSITLSLGIITFCIVYFSLNYLFKSEEQKDWIDLIRSKIS